MTSPTLSAVVPNYNHGRHLAGSLGAILSQSRPCDELVVCDDASTDDSLAILEALAREHPNLRILQNERNLGVIETARRLIHAASGDYIYLGAADDRVLPGLFEQSMAMLTEYPQAGLSVALAHLLDGDARDTGMILGRRLYDRPRFISPNECLRLFEQHGGWIPAVSAIFKREALIDAGLHEDLGPFADGFPQQIVALRSGVCYLPEVLAAFRETATGYGTTQSLNVSGYLERVRFVTSLMRGPYADIFPPPYVRRQQEIWLYWAGANAGRNLATAHATYLSHLAESLSPVRSTDRCVFFLLAASMRCQLVVARCYLFVRRRHLRMAMITGRIMWLWRRMFPDAGRGERSALSD